MSKIEIEDRKFYNPQYKIPYLEESPNTLKTRERALTMEMLGWYEEQLGKDLGQMTRDELLHAFDDYRISSYSSLMIKLTYVRQYLVWYSTNVEPVPAQNLTIKWKEYDLRETFRNYLLESPADIPVDWAKLRPEEGHYIQPVAVFGWHGLYYYEMAKLKKTDVVDDGNQIVIHAHDRDIVIDDPTCIEILRAYSSVKSRQTKKKIWVPQKTDLFLYRMIHDEPKRDFTATILSKSVESLRTKRGRHMEGKYDIKMLTNAGEYHRVIDLENERNKGVPDKKDWVWATDDEIRSITGDSNARESQMRALRHSINVYRQAYNL